MDSVCQRSAPVEEPAIGREIERRPRALVSLERVLARYARPGRAGGPLSSLGIRLHEAGAALLRHSRALAAPRPGLPALLAEKDARIGDLRQAIADLRAEREAARDDLAAERRRFAERIALLESRMTELSAPAALPPRVDPWAADPERERLLDGVAAIRSELDGAGAVAPGPVAPGPDGARPKPG